MGENCNYVKDNNNKIENNNKNNNINDIIMMIIIIIAVPVQNFWKLKIQTDSEESRVSHDCISDPALNSR